MVFGSKTQMMISSMEPDLKTQMISYLQRVEKSDADTLQKGLDEGGLKKHI